MAQNKGEVDLGRSEQCLAYSIQQCSNLGRRLRADWQQQWKVKGVFQSYLRGKKNNWGEDV